MRKSDSRLAVKIGFSHTLIIKGAEIQRLYVSVGILIFRDFVPAWKSID
jgi:hypothetical protein